MTFPTTAHLTVEVSLALGADLTADPGTWSWTDVTAYLRLASGVEITQGRRDETDRSQPAQCRIVLNNTSGRFTPRNAAGAYYPNVRLNTPLRVRVNPGSGLTTRFTGFVDEWPIRWDVSGNEKHVEVTASGVLRRLNQGGALRSALYREILSTSNLVAYWPLEGGSRATQVVSPVPGVGSMWGDLELDGSDGPGGSDPSLPSLASRGELFGRVPYSGATSFRIECVAKLGLNGVGTTVLQWSTPGTISLWRIEANTTDFQVTYYVGAVGTTILLSGASAYDGAWHHLRVDVADNGANIDTDLTVDGVLVDSTTIAGAGFFWPEDVGLVTFDTDADESMVQGIGHVAVWSSSAVSTNTPDAATGWNGEQASDRIARICTEEGIDSTVSAGTGTALGPQPVDTLLAILQDAESTDLGLLYETGAGVAYIAREDRYNLSAALALNIDSGHVQHPLEANDDDQRIRNKVIVSQHQGASGVVYEDTDGPLGTATVGIYEETRDVNLADESQLYAHAGWLVNLGTVDDLRYPAVGLNFARAPSLIASWLAAGIGSRATVANPPAELPAGSLDLQVVGYVEYFDRFNWAVTLNTVPNRPYNVIVLDGTGNTSRLDTAGSQFNGSHNSSTTSLSIETTTGALWSTTDEPYDIGSDGEQITLTVVTGASSPQTGTATRSVNGVSKTHADNAAISLWRPSVLAL